jgi:hypothetical protein
VRKLRIGLWMPWVGSECPAQRIYMYLCMASWPPMVVGLATLQRIKTCPNSMVTREISAELSAVISKCQTGFRASNACPYGCCNAPERSQDDFCIFPRCFFRRKTENHLNKYHIEVPEGTGGVFSQLKLS